MGMVGGDGADKFVSPAALDGGEAALDSGKAQMGIAWLHAE
jgi:hypothetical protein